MQENFRNFRGSIRRIARHDSAALRPQIGGLIIVMPRGGRGELNIRPHRIEAASLSFLTLQSVGLTGRIIRYVEEGCSSCRIELYPMRTESGERMMMVYFPEHKLLYGSDLVQQRRDGSFFMPEYLSELTEAVRREKLTVSAVFAMHTGVTPWSAIEAAVAKANAAG